jgi:hypothetical protein
MISALYAPNVPADLFHHPRTLMAQHHRVAGLKPVVAVIYIGTADARGDESHQDFVIARTFHFEGFDLQRAAPLAQNGRFNPVHIHFLSSQAEKNGYYSAQSELLAKVSVIPEPD